MATKYILAGGNDRSGQDYWQKLSVATGQTNPRVLNCFFAQMREDWEEKFTSFDSFFKSAFGQNTSRQLAFPAKFRDQVRESDIIYLHGGDDMLLAHHLAEFKDIGNMFTGKIVIGSSAGADFLSTNYWPCDWREIKRGSGLTPLNIIVHYGSDYGKDDPRGPIDWELVREEFSAAVKGATITPLREGELIVFES